VFESHENIEGFELLISAVLKPKVDVDKTILHKFIMQTDSDSVKG